MADAPSPRQRIDAAIDRIAAAVERRRTAAAELTGRHETLRRRTAEAIAAIDGLLAREGDA